MCVCACACVRVCVVCACVCVCACACVCVCGVCVCVCVCVCTLISASSWSILTGQVSFFSVFCVRTGQKSIFEWADAFLFCFEFSIFSKLIYLFIYFFFNYMIDIFETDG